MPIRTRRKKPVAEPKQVLQQKDRLDNVEKDEYYYLSFLWRNTVDDFEDTIELLKSKNLPFQWAKSPSNCMCFRIRRVDWKSRPELRKPNSKKYERSCPAFMPYSCYKRHVLWQMEETNHFPFLYHKWTSVLPNMRRRRRC